MVTSTAERVNVRKPEQVVLDNLRKSDWVMQTWHH